MHLVGCLYYLYQWCTIKQISGNEIYLWIKYIKRVLWRGAKHLSYIEDAWSLKVNKNLGTHFNIGLSEISVNIGQYWKFYRKTNRHFCVSSVNAEQNIYRRKRCSRQTIGAEYSELLIAPKMFRKNFLSEKTVFQTEYHIKTKKVPQRLSIGAKYSGQIIAANMFRTDFLSKQNIQDYRTTFRTKKVSDRPRIGAKMFPKDFYQSKNCLGQAMYRSKMFRTLFLSEKNVPDRLFIGATNIMNGKLHTKFLQIYCPWGLPLAIHRRQTKDSACATVTVTRTFLTCCHPKSCLEQWHQSNYLTPFICYWRSAHKRRRITWRIIQYTQ